MYHGGLLLCYGWAKYMHNKVNHNVLRVTHNHNALV